jgi:hypothetical protein
MLNRVKIQKCIWSSNEIGPGRIAYRDDSGFTVVLTVDEGRAFPIPAHRCYGNQEVGETGIVREYRGRGEGAYLFIGDIVLRKLEEPVPEAPVVARKAPLPKTRTETPPSTEVPYDGDPELLAIAKINRTLDILPPDSRDAVLQFVIARRTRQLRRDSGRSDTLGDELEQQSVAIERQIRVVGLGARNGEE